MKLLDLRAWLKKAAAIDGMSLSAVGAQELVADIDVALKEAAHNAAQQVAAMMPRWPNNQAPAPANSELGIELSKIRDRLDVLESRAAAVSNTLTAHAKDITRLDALAKDGIEGRLALGNDTKPRIGLLEDTVGEQQVVLASLADATTSLENWRERVSKAWKG